MSHLIFSILLFSNSSSVCYISADCSGFRVLCDVTLMYTTFFAVGLYKKIYLAFRGNVLMISLPHSLPDVTVLSSTVQCPVKSASFVRIKKIKLSIIS